MTSVISARLFFLYPIIIPTNKLYNLLIYKYNGIYRKLISCKGDLFSELVFIKMKRMDIIFCFLIRVEIIGYY